MGDVWNERARWKTQALTLVVEKYGLSDGTQDMYEDDANVVKVQKAENLLKKINWIKSDWHGEVSLPSPWDVSEVLPGTPIHPQGHSSPHQRDLVHG